MTLDLPSEAKIALIRLGLTVEEAATAVRVSRVHLSLVLHGHRRGSRKLRQRIARLLGPEVAALLGHEADVTPVTSPPSRRNKRAGGVR